MSTRARVAALVAVCLVAVAATAAYLLASRDSQQRALREAPAQATVSVAALQEGPRIVFRNTAIGPNYGRVAMVPLDDPGSARALTDVSCDRVFATTTRTLCLASDRGVVTTYTARVLTRGEAAPRDLPLTGIPSRARLSRDGSLAATTSFVSGDSYATSGFSTRTVVTTPRRLERRPRDLPAGPPRKRHRPGGPQLLGRDVRCRRRHLLCHGLVRRTELAVAGAASRAGR